MTSANGWRLAGWAHDNTLTTEVTDTRIPNARIVGQIENDALDFGASFQNEVRLSGHVSGRYGFDFIGRRGVTAAENVTVTLPDGTTRVFAKTTLDGEQDEAAAFGSLRRSLGAATLSAGGRFTWQRQSNRSTVPLTDQAWTGFLGIVRPLGDGGWELAANIGAGLRFPNLSERYFSGLTGRGQVVGNADLDPERSTSFDVGLRFYGRRLFWNVQVFDQSFSDYIERIEVGEPPMDEIRTFVNLTSGRIKGIELEGFFKLDERWQLSWSGHLIDGEAADPSGAGGKQPLSDVPSNRLQVGLAFREGRWAASATVQHRREEDEPAGGEKAIPAADLVSLSLDYELTDGLHLTLRGRNLLDEAYFNSADRKTALAPGRSFGLGLIWER